MRKPIIYSIIVTYNRKNLLKKCINSILKQSYPVKKIIVVDNLSTDGTREYLKSIQKKIPKIYPIFNETNAGMAHAINLALKEIKNKKWDYVWITDDDNIVEKNTLKTLLKYAKRDRIVAPILLKYKHNDKLSYPYFDRKTETQISKIDKEKVKIYGVSIFNFGLLPKDFINKIKKIPEVFFIRGEEIFTTFTADLLNFKCQTIVSAKAYCLTERNIKIIKVLNINLLVENLTSWKFFYHVRNNLILTWFFKKTKYEKSKIVKYYSVRHNFFLFFFGWFTVNFFIIIFYYKKIKFLNSLIKAYLNFLFSPTKLLLLDEYKFLLKS